jgi:ATP-dependent phosphofructokinase / diphosphate-dependent phosphofructokinase
MTMTKVGILTGGGDCPGLNAVIRGVAKSAFHEYGMEVIGFMDGFLGLIERRYVTLSREKVSGILTQGGTILGTTNKADPFAHIEVNGGKSVKQDLSDSCVKLYHELGLQALICLGGDGTQSIAGRFAQKGLNVVGVPKTIDKDVAGTDETFGFDSARAMATEAIDRLHSTAAAHHRVMVVEVMGRNAGWLALESCIAGGGDIVLIPEIPFEISNIAQALKERHDLGRRSSIVVVAEGSRPKGGEQTCAEMTGQPSNPIRLGGVSQIVASLIERATNVDCRVAVLGHLQRGGTPTPYDRLLATRFAIKAMELVSKGEFNRMVALRNGAMDSVPISEVVGKQKTIPLDSPLIKVAKAVGTSFGGSV